MNRSTLAFAFILGSASAIQAGAPSALNSLHAVHILSNAEASRALPVSFEATVTYYRDYERTLFVQDVDEGIYVYFADMVKVAPGDRIRIVGITHESFRPYVEASSIVALRHGALPKPFPVSFEDMMRVRDDCRLVTMRGTIRSADPLVSVIAPVRSTHLQLLTDGGVVQVLIESDDSGLRSSLLDAEVEIAGVASGKFDGKMQQTGVVLHVTSFADLKVIKRAVMSPWENAPTPMDQVLAAYHVNDLSPRTRVHGTITYYEPGKALVLQDGAKSLWIETQVIAPLRIGDLADVTGFPGTHNGFLSLTYSEVLDSRVSAPIEPKAVTWTQLVSSRNIFDLVSIEGKVTTEVREPTQDEYVLLTGGQLFTAVYRHPSIGTALPQMRMIPLGATIRVTGICVLEDSNPYDGQIPFSILMRSFDDISVLSNPSLLTVRNLVIVVSLLLIIVVAAVGWGWTLKRKVHQQTAALALRAEIEAARERRMARLEQQRSRILEDINGLRPLTEIIEQIAEFISFQLGGVPCWCEIADGARLGNRPAEPEGMRIVRHEIAARSGPALGVFFAGLAPLSEPSTNEFEALSAGVRLASLAIENRRIYSDMLYRSDFDLLTDVHNRFSLEKHLDNQIEKAHASTTIFGLVYIDLDGFKQVNDLYGHHVGDLYLQEASLRMKRQLRAHDVLARMGGDEFTVLLTRVHSRADVQEIALRLKHCFDASFMVDGQKLSGSASVGIALYPEDGATKDSLLSVADAAMYRAKKSSKQAAAVEATAAPALLSASRI